MMIIEARRPLHRRPQSIHRLGTERRESSRPKAPRHFASSPRINWTILNCVRRDTNRSNNNGPDEDLRDRGGGRRRLESRRGPRRRHRAREQGENETEGGWGRTIQLAFPLAAPLTNGSFFLHENTYTQMVSRDEKQTKNRRRAAPASTTTAASSSFTT